MPVDALATELKDSLKRLRLGKLVDTLPQRLTLARQQKMPHQDFLLLLLQDEVSRRDSNAITIRGQRARLEPEMRLENWDPSTEVTFDRDLLNELVSLRFLLADHPQNVTIVGPVGVGKTFLSHALGHLACASGYSVLAVRTDQMLKSLRHARLDDRDMAGAFVELKRPADFETVLAGHHHVGNDDVGDELKCLFDAGLSVLCRHDLVVFFQNGNEIGGDVPVVFDEEKLVELFRLRFGCVQRIFFMHSILSGGFHLDIAPGGRAARLPNCRILPNRKQHGEVRPDCFPAFYRDAAAHQFNEFLGHGQANTGTFAGAGSALAFIGIHLVKTVEDVWQLVLWDPYAGIAHL